MSSPQCFSKAQSKYQNATSVPKRKLEESYCTTIEDMQEPDPKKAKNDAEELASHRNVMDDLRKKFEKSDSYQEKLPVLTESPSTIERTENLLVQQNTWLRRVEA